MAAESTVFDQVMGHLQKMDLTGLRNFIGRTASTLPGRSLGGEGGFRLDKEPLPFDRSPEQSQAAAEEIAFNFLSPGMIIGREGAKRLGGELWRKFLAGERAAGEGMAPQRLWRDFGYARGAEGKGRMEISDVPAEIKRTGDTTVGEGIHHPELFKAYPELAKLPLEMRLGAAQTTGGFNTSTGRIRVHAPDMVGGKSAAMHELQHGVQREEQFAPGTSLKLGPEQYVRSAGEVEARNVQARLKNPDLMQFTPEMTESLPRAAQLGKDAKWEDFIARNPQAAKMLLTLKGLRR